MLDQPQCGSRVARISAGWRALPGNVRGAVWILVGGFSYTLVQALVKVAGARLPVVEILFLRQLLMLLIVLPAIWRQRRTVFKTRKLTLHLGRAASIVTAMLLGFSAVVHLPLADATAIGFSQSLFVTIFAVFILAESVAIGGWIATLVGLIGVMVMLRPGAGVIEPYAVVALLGAAGGAMVAIVTRKLSEFDRPLTIFAYHVTLVGLVLAPPTLFFWLTPTPQEMLLIVAIGIFSVISQFANIRGFRAGQAAAIAPFDYSRLLFASIIGVVVFATWPTLQTIIGALIILSACIYTLHREGISRRRPNTTHLP